MVLKPSTSKDSVAPHRVTGPCWVAASGAEACAAPAPSTSAAVFERMITARWLARSRAIVLASPPVLPLCHATYLLPHGTVMHLWSRRVTHAVYIPSIPRCIYMCAPTDERFSLPTHTFIVHYIS